MKRFFTVTLLALLLGVLAACGSSKSESVAIGFFPNLDHAAAIVGKEKGFFEEEMTGKELDFTSFPNGNDFIEALDNNAIQLGYVGPGPAINYFLAGGDIVVLGAAANGATLIVAREGSGIETLEDFAGKSFCTPGNGCTHNVQLEIMLQDMGLTTTRRGGVVDHQPRVNPANMMIMFESGEIDAAAAPEPWGTYLVEEFGAKVITEWNEVYLGETLASVVVVTTPKFLKENPEAVDQFLKAHKRAVDYTYENTADTLVTINDHLFNISQQRLPESVLENAWKRMVVTTETHADALQAWATASYELNFIDNEPNLEGFVDTSRLDKIISGN
ncbi:aliphatic sulfonate ABC transporter substrate-binding protein [Anaerobacillus isosaccharinicus]|uniref:ABC transporter substrate-binding protein n=1 Tax=Anaerobacillus isosaccharinicus TaxID=1532552 RepID=A0A1S2KU03_9BACI|nr:aliphatic sulfonate ABC transporter substrate-binding protein [Anaerobacillus isosaccharinicus]MBA5585334.1 aliphatic sulfonate ABC transporter substrate-binding protein [Anaerobacillus isosaccharinicus]QOY36340.1 aliphatic sulfonate ABC transporter substrate-binding protein [Anaerobacillus isosaccharinicus]